MEGFKPDWEDPQGWPQPAQIVKAKIAVWCMVLGLATVLAAAVLL